MSNMTDGEREMVNNDDSHGKKELFVLKAVLKAVRI
jgi:hypothetical protein